MVRELGKTCRSYEAMVPLTVARQTPLRSGVLETQNSWARTANWPQFSLFNFVNCDKLLKLFFDQSRNEDELTTRQISFGQ